MSGRDSNRRGNLSEKQRSCEFATQTGAEARINSLRPLCVLCVFAVRRPCASVQMGTGRRLKESENHDAHPLLFAITEYGLRRPTSLSHRSKPCSIMRTCTNRAFIRLAAESEIGICDKDICYSGATLRHHNGACACSRQRIRGGTPANS